MCAPCHIVLYDSLCSLAEAYLYSVSHQIPSSSEFSTYDGLRLNWKKKVSF